MNTSVFIVVQVPWYDIRQTPYILRYQCVRACYMFEVCIRSYIVAEGWRNIITCSRGQIPWTFGTVSDVSYVELWCRTDFETIIVVPGLNEWNTSTNSLLFQHDRDLFPCYFRSTPITPQIAFMVKAIVTVHVPSVKPHRVTRNIAATVLHQLPFCRISIPFAVSFQPRRTKPWNPKHASEKPDHLLGCGILDCYLVSIRPLT